MLELIDAGSTVDRANWLLTDSVVTVPLVDGHTSQVDGHTSQVGSTSGPNDAVQQPENEEHDPFDNEEEYVGVDDENLYNVYSPINVVLPSPENAGEGEDAMHEAEFVQQFEEDAEVADFDPLQYSVQHDPERPDIRVGALFPDIIAFRKAIRQHAVLEDFEFANGKTDRTRFIANCAWHTCPWRIHASRLRDETVIIVWKK